MIVQYDRTKAVYLLSKTHLIAHGRAAAFFNGQQLHRMDLLADRPYHICQRP